MIFWIYTIGFALCFAFVVPGVLKVSDAPIVTLLSGILACALWPVVVFVWLWGWIK
jgi:hypothetical protein